MIDGTYKSAEGDVFTFKTSLADTLIVDLPKPGGGIIQKEYKKIGINGLAFSFMDEGRGAAADRKFVGQYVDGKVIWGGKIELQRVSKQGVSGIIIASVFLILSIIATIYYFAK